MPSGAKFTDTITTINNKTGVVTKADITALGIPAQDTTYNTVTTTTNGLMIATDKTKLDGIESGANKYTHPSTHPSSMITGLSNISTSGNYNDLNNKPLDDNFSSLTSAVSALSEDELLIYQSSTSTYKKITKENLLTDSGSSDYVLINKKEEFVTTQNQTVFNLTTGEYTHGANRIDLYLNGLKQPKASFIETNPTTVTLKHPIDGGQIISIEWLQFSKVIDYVHANNHITGGNDVIPNVVASGNSGLMSGADKSKLNSIETEANKYIHPLTHLASMITESTSRRFVSDTEKATWNGKSNFSGSYTDLTNKPTIPDTSTLMPISGGVLENYREKLTTVSASGGSINLSLGNVFQHTPSGNRTYSITMQFNGQAHSFTLIINMGSTVRTLTFPASVKWQGGEIPDMTTASKTYVLTFMTVDGGTNWLGMFGGEF